MRFTTCHVALFGSLVAIVAAMPQQPANPATCTTRTSTATYDSLPTGPLSSTKPHGGLLYTGWEVVEADMTPFAAHSGKKFLRLVGSNGDVTSAHKGEYYNDPGGPSNPSFYFGCENTTTHLAENCGFGKDYSDPNDGGTYFGFFNATAYPNTLEAAGGDAPEAVHNIYWTLATGAGATAPSDLVLYIDSYIHTISNCQTT